MSGLVRACRKLGFNQRTTLGLDATRFRPPPQQGDQLSRTTISLLLEVATGLIHPGRGQISFERKS